MVCATAGSRWWEPKLSILGLYPIDNVAQEQGKVWETSSWQRHVAMGIWALVFFLFLSWSLWIFLVQTSEPYGLDMSGWEKAFLAASSSPSPDILGTQIYGEEAAMAFRQRLACFSESGAWKYDVRPRKLPWNFAGDPFANQCDGRHVSTPGNVAGLAADAIAALDGTASNWRVRTELKWVWTSNSSCPMQPLDRDNLCRLIGPNSNMLLVGDSITHELQWVLLNNLISNTSGIVPSLSSVRTWEGLEVCDDVLGPGRGFKIGFVRNDRLSLTQDIRDDGWSNVLEWPWLQLLGPWGIRVLILNRGAHFEADDVFSSALEETLGLLRRHYPHLLVIFRNTPPGHKNCATYTAPLLERQQDLPPEWHWGEFLRQNQLAKAIAERNQVLYMDVDTALSLRPDGHIDANDCLHYCLPGPLDYAAHLLYNVFLALDLFQSAR